MATARCSNMCGRGSSRQRSSSIPQAYSSAAYSTAKGRGPSKKKARRWVVECMHSWFNRFRSILTRRSKKAKNYLGMLSFVCGLTSYRAAGLFE